MFGNITVVNPPNAFITAAGPNIICPESYRTIYSNNTAAYGNHQWYLNGSPISGATSYSYNASSAGNYTVTVTNMCGSTTSAPWTLTLIIYHHPSRKQFYYGEFWKQIRKYKGTSFQSMWIWWIQE